MALCGDCRHPPRSRLVIPKSVRERYRYATDADYRAERRQHAHARSRGVKPIPVIGQRNLLDMFDGLCAYCRLRPASTWDHIIPISRGGETVPGNIVPACASCNASKGNRNVARWVRKKGFTEIDGLMDVLSLAEEVLR